MQRAGMTSTVLRSVNRPGPKTPAFESASRMGSVSAAAVSAAAAQKSVPAIFPCSRMAIDYFATSPETSGLGKPNRSIDTGVYYPYGYLVR